MQLNKSSSCNNKKHKVNIVVYNFETIEQVTGVASFVYEGSTSDISNSVANLVLNSDGAARICRQACCEVAAKATGLQDIEVVGNV